MNHIARIPVRGHIKFRSFFFLSGRPFGEVELEFRVEDRQRAAVDHLLAEVDLARPGPHQVGAGMETYEL